MSKVAVMWCWQGLIYSSQVIEIFFFFLENKTHHHLITELVIERVGEEACD